VSEQQSLRDDILITVTSFFRDPEAWDYLKSSLLPTVLVTACSTGEEAYTVAMILLEMMDASDKEISFKVYATDVERKSLDLASIGSYSEHAIKQLSKERRKRFFTQTTCRNVLIYMQPELQQKAIRMLHFSLNVDGVLFIGSSETLGPQQNEFTPVNREWNQYRKLRNLRLPLHLSSDRTFRPPESRNTNETDPAVSGRNTITSLSLEVLSRHTGNTNVLVDGNRNVVSVISDPTGILEVRPGEPTTDITRMVPEGIGPSLTFAVARATKEQVNVAHANLKCTPKNQSEREVDVDSMC